MPHEHLAHVRFHTRTSNVRGTPAFSLRVRGKVSNPSKASVKPGPIHPQRLLPGGGWWRGEVRCEVWTKLGHAQAEGRGGWVLKHI
mgnify:CR=1 FL=1